SPTHQLTESNCPQWQSFLPYLHIWAQHVTLIQSLTPKSQHDLTCAICSLPPLQQYGGNSDIPRIVSDLRAVAIEINQRRTFQVMYGNDLQAAIDAGQDISSPGGRQVKTSFMPPPVYEPSPPLPTTSSSKPPLSRPPSPTILSSTSPTIELIRKTLYATLADILKHQPSLPLLLKSDPPRAYFASVSLTILNMSLNCIDPEDGSARGVLGQKLTLVECPTELKGFMMELGLIGQTVRQMEEEDSETVVHLLSVGATEIPTPRLDRIRWMLEKGVGSSHQSGSGRESPEGRTVAFVNRVNALALGLTRLKAFRERQGEVFKVLAGVGGR
ncbi:hypothetical protein JAAARDRAFT_140199, partial [Jaapia argillacea MUCL 33604]